jgi:TolB-like protein/Tfp pilus assembly protein PilF
MSRRPEPSPSAVFLSYARQDADAARRIATALRAQGLAVWFDEEELRGGDAWDAKIRRQIKDCALFVPVISANTQARLEGYFRLEWKLAEDRSHLMARGKPFILPVTVDATTEEDAHVPDSFCAVQWTRLLDDQGRVGFAHRLRTLLEGAPTRGVPPAEHSSARAPVAADAGRRTRWGGVALTFVALGLVVTALLVGRRWKSPATPAATVAPPEPSGATAAADAKSIAVLPFENLGGDPTNAAFTDGMHEEMLTALGKVAALNVIGRTSVLPYRDAAHRDLPRISAELGIGSVVEGTVRRIGNRVRIAVQLVDARSRRQLWADAYEKDATDVFAIQAAVAEEVTAKLRATLTHREQQALAQKPTSNTRAYELYLEAKGQRNAAAGRLQMWDEAAGKFERATQLDPQFASAFAQLAYTHSSIYFYPNLDQTPARRDRARQALEAAQRLTPDSAETLFATGYFAYACLSDYPAALRNYEAARATIPNDSALHFALGLVLRRLGRHAEAATELARSVALDPLENRHRTNYAQSLLTLRRFADVVQLAATAVDDTNWTGAPGLTIIARARFELSGDRARLIEDWKAAVRADPANGTALRTAAEAQIFAGDYGGALRTLSDAGIEKGLNAGALLALQVDRAILAHVAGRRELLPAFEERARQLSAFAVSDRNGGRPVLRASVMLDALHGRAAEAHQGMEKMRADTRDDSFFDLGTTFSIGTAHLLLGERDAALACLRQLMTGPSLDTQGPRMIRLDPVWSQLNGDPEFERILNAARPL